MFVRSKELVAAICAGGGTKTIAYQALAAKWVQPLNRRNRFVIYGDDAAKIVLARLGRGDFPCPPAGESKKAKGGHSNAN